MGIVRTMVAEMVPQKEVSPSIMPGQECRLGTDC